MVTILFKESVTAYQLGHECPASLLGSFYPDSASASGGMHREVSTRREQRSRPFPLHSPEPNLPLTKPQACCHPSAALRLLWQHAKQSKAAANPVCFTHVTVTSCKVVFPYSSQMW